MGTLRGPSLRKFEGRIQGNLLRSTKGPPAPSGGGSPIAYTFIDFHSHVARSLTFRTNSSRPCTAPATTMTPRRKVARSAGRKLLNSNGILKHLNPAFAIAAEAVTSLPKYPARSHNP